MTAAINATLAEQSSPAVTGWLDRMVVPPYYRDTHCAIYHGNNLDLLPKMQPVDAIVTDPPYGVNKAEWDKHLPTAWIPLAYRIAPRLAVMCGNTALMELGHALGYTYKDTLVLHNRNGMTLAPTGYGNWIPVVLGGEWDWQQRQNVLAFNVTTEEEIAHPSPKPLQAMRKLLEKYCSESWMILDPFCGSGTTLKAAKEMNRCAIGIEMEERYCEVAAKRLAQGVML